MKEKEVSSFKRKETKSSSGLLKVNGKPLIDDRPKQVFHVEGIILGLINGLLCEGKLGGDKYEVKEDSIVMNGYVICVIDRDNLAVALATSPDRSMIEGRTSYSNKVFREFISVFRLNKINVVVTDWNVQYGTAKLRLNKFIDAVVSRSMKRKEI